MYFYLSFDLIMIFTDTSGSEHLRIYGALLIFFLPNALDFGQPFLGLFAKKFIGP